MDRRRDTMSRIPDELLLKILSSLPTKYAIATSVLSKRWRNLWKEVKTYRYDAEYFDIYRFLVFIYKRSSVERLQLRLNKNVTDTFINPLVSYAVNRSLRELRIEMVYNSFSFPKSLYISSQLETLILEKLSLMDVPPNVRFTCLKRLRLLSVRFAGDQSVKTLLSICPRLEDLVVRRSSYTNVMIFTIDVPTLRNLSIDNSSGKSRPTGVHGFVINAPSLRRFCIRDSFSNYLRFENMPQLVKASVKFNLWNQPNSVPECLSSHLEILEWRQYKGTEPEREAANYILANASRLKKAIFSADKHGMLKDLECVPRASKTCQLVFE